MLGGLERCGNRIKIAQRHQVNQLRFEQVEQSNEDSACIQMVRTGEYRQNLQKIDPFLIEILNADFFVFSKP